MCILTAQRNFIPPLYSETARIRFRRARFQTLSSVSFWVLTELQGENSASSSQSIICVPKRLTKFFAELSEFSLPKQYSRNSIPPVSKKKNPPLEVYFAGWGGGCRPPGVYISFAAWELSGRPFSELCPRLVLQLSGKRKKKQ